jgi:hypothetical protein
MTPCVAAYVSRGWFLPVQLLRDVSPASREPLRAAAYGFHAGDTSVLPWSCRAIYPPAHLLQTSTSRRQQPASQATTNRVSRQTDSNPAAAPPDEAAPTEPRRSASRPALPRRRVGQLRVAGDGAAAAPKGVPPCSSQVLPPAEPGSGRVARTTSRAAYTWHAAGRKLSQHPMLGGAALPAGPVFTILLHAGQPRTGRRRGERHPDLPARLTRNPGRTRRAWGYQWSPSVWSSRISRSAPPRRRVPAAASTSSSFGPVVVDVAGRLSQVAPRATTCGPTTRG